ncbi:MAG: PQQ-dependent sugar dehydrogenase [Blastocatellia bacterium]
MKIAPVDVFRMSWKPMFLFALCILAAFSLPVSSQQPAAPQGPPQPAELQAPAGFKVSVYAGPVANARLMAVAPDGVLVVARNLPKDGQVVALPDRNKDGKADSVDVLGDKLDRPHSVAFNKGWLYVATMPSVLRAKYAAGKIEGQWEKIVDLPVSTTSHWTRTIGFGKDGKMYVAIGSSCNVCEETADDRRTTLMQYNADGTGGRVYAKGFRNMIGFDWDPKTGALWGDDMGQDGLGEERPGDEVNKIEEGKNYGYPYYVENNVPNEGLKDAKGSLKADQATKPAFLMMGHVSPIGVSFYKGKAFPEPWRGGLYVALHGSSPRARPDKVGYKVVRIVFDKSGKATGTEDFLTGFLKDGNVLGRPAGMATGNDGSFFVSDDGKGFIYRVTYEKK